MVAPAGAGRGMERHGVGRWGEQLRCIRGLQDLSMRKSATGGRPDARWFGRPLETAGLGSGGGLLRGHEPGAARPDRPGTPAVGLHQRRREGAESKACERAWRQARSNSEWIGSGGDRIRPTGQRLEPAPPDTQERPPMVVGRLGTSNTGVLVNSCVGGADSRAHIQLLGSRTTSGKGPTFLAPSRRNTEPTPTSARSRKSPTTPTCIE